MCSSMNFSKIRGLLQKNAKTYGEPGNFSEFSGNSREFLENSRRIDGRSHDLSEFIENAQDSPGISAKTQKSTGNLETSRNFPGILGNSWEIREELTGDLRIYRNLSKIQGISRGFLDDDD